ncbi:PREDICTED: zinc finger protein 280B [Elephantulus edwardii]|uniref:zinc finger protein 280B n=1 Tax=Elephantulus edwardii TaxID=28737 RepID=UPI0003F06ECE|nr:PREDICTED: zinc finger protein 280B [Elephantulus edwardii]
MESVCVDEPEEPEPRKSMNGAHQAMDGDDDELILLGVEHVHEDAELIFVGATSGSKPIVSTILNRVTPGSHLRRRKYIRCRPERARSISQPGSLMTALSEVVAPASPPQSRSTDSPIIIESLPNSDCGSNSPQASPSSPPVKFLCSLPPPGGAAFSLDLSERPCVDKLLSTSEVNRVNLKRPQLSDGILGDPPSPLSPSDIPTTQAAWLNTPSQAVNTSVNHVQERTPFLTAFPKDNANLKPINSYRETGKLVKMDLSRQTSQKETFKAEDRPLMVLVHDFYYGQQEGNRQPEQKTYTTFKCLSCLKVLKNIKFMNHMKHHLEYERQRGDSWESHTTCQYCYRRFPTPFELQCHVDSVHSSQEPSFVCKICELSFVTDQALLQHMKDTHKPGEMPYVCQVCGYRSSFCASVEAHFRACHENTKSLLCPFCLKVFKVAKPYMCHYWGHREKSVHQCSKCRLQFLTFKKKIEHKTQCHQMFKRPKQLEGLPPDTKVVIQVSSAPQQGSGNVASIVVNSSDMELEELPPKLGTSSSSKLKVCKPKSKAPI